MLCTCECHCVHCKPNHKPLGWLQGVYEVSFIPQMAGTYALNVMLSGVAVKDCPIKIKVLADETLAKNCRCFGSGMAHATAGDPTSFTIQAVDGRGVARKSGGDVFEVNITGPEGDNPHATIRDNAEGTYTVTWAGKYAGLYAIRIQLDGASVGGTPFNCNVLSTVIAPAMCEVQANSASIVRAGERAEFRIISRDAYGNVRSQGGDEFVVLVRMIEGPGKTEVQATVTEESKGFYKAAFVVKHTGVYQVLVATEGQPIKGVPFKCTVNSGRPDFTKCKLGGPGLQAVRLGQPCDVLVELYDIYSNRITSALDALSDIQVCIDKFACKTAPLKNILSCGHTFCQ
jgi:filamin